MELDFDKEINALLRQAAKDNNQWSAVGGRNDGNPQSAAGSPQSHLDADEISAFAENALPEKTRNVYIKHFAECDRCRKILSNTILLNTEAETETASSVVAAPLAPEIVETQIPWYRKMFLMPNLAYTMGALVLVFGGMLGFIALQSLYKTGSSDVSQIQNAPTRSSGPNASDDGIPYNPNGAASNSNSATINSTTTANTSANSTANVSGSAISNTQALPLNEPLAQPSVPAEQQNPSPAKPVDDLALAKKSESKDVKAAELSDKNKTAETAREDEVTTVTTDSAAPPPAPKAMPSQPSTSLRRAEKAPQTESEERKRDRATSGAVNDSRQVGGKIFNRVNGVWIDSAYNSNGSLNMALPRTKTVRRGSSEYRKLDRQVRIIAESLDGAVIVVWRDGAYRIQ